MANASGFYSNLIAVKRYWESTLEDEGMMHLSLPDTALNNGTWLVQQARSNSTAKQPPPAPTHGLPSLTPWLGAGDTRDCEIDDLPGRHLAR